MARSLLAKAMINDNAKPSVRVVVVGNPCNTNCLIVMKSAPNIPNEQFFAMTRLDENRAKTQLRKRPVYL